MEKAKYFEREINLIQNEDYRMFVAYYLKHYCPDYFWEIGASSSGKYHPQFSQGKGGLVRHTKAVVLFAEELLRMSSYMYMSEEFKDYVIMACILHDTCKYGSDTFEKEKYKYHAMLASVNVANCWEEYFEEQAPVFFTNAIKTHMGQWSEKEDRPFTNIDRCVHMADYMASRSFIDIPQVSEEYEAVQFEETESKESQDPINPNSIGGQMVRKMIEFYEKDNNMDINEVPRKKMATEWDMGWFCDKCEKLVHWKTKSYEVNGQHLCRECAERALKRP